MDNDTDSRRAASDDRAGRPPVARCDDSFCLLMAEDDPDDQLLMRRALQESGISCAVCVVENGEELIDFLRRRGAYEGREGPPVGLILLDLNMPRMDGREVLRLMKQDPDLRRIPVVVLTTSEAEKDVFESYDLGAGAFVTKPVAFDGLVQTIERLGAFWFDTARLPQ